MSGFPMLMPKSLPIRVGTEYKTPYQWAAEFAPSEQLVQYKDAMLWLEGEEFASKEIFLDKVKRVLEFQEKEKLVNTNSVTVPEVIEETEETPSTSISKRDDDKGWKTTQKPKRKPKAQFVKWTRQQLATAIVDRCIEIFHRTFSFTGPSLDISDVYPQFDKNEFTYPALIGSIRDALNNVRGPSVEGFPVPRSARYWAESSAGKAKNFNFKVQKVDKLKPNGWSAVAQVHVLWQ
jgi:hypothetical protein